MSKCDLQIVFDRSDRTYRGGDEVSGTVLVQVNADVRCNGLKVEHFWQTHGRGNKTTGPKQTEILFEGNLQAGETLSYPFRFIAPEGPPTYRGNYLNIDHYVHARVDVPWSIDPKLQEEYILLPGNGEYGNLPSGRQMNRKAFGEVSSKVLPIGVGIIVVGLLLPTPFNLFLIGFGIVLGVLGIRRMLVAKRLGKVDLHLDAPRVAPGRAVPVRLRFTPRQSATINGITAKLKGIERCVSGSGTNRSTHKHTIHEEEFTLAPGGELVAGEPVEINTAVPIPRGSAYSFYTGDNELLWTLDVRIDVPLWPDWAKTQMLVVRPCGPEPGDTSEAAVPVATGEPRLTTVAMAAPLVNTPGPTSRDDMTVALDGEATLHQAPPPAPPTPPSSPNPPELPEEARPAAESEPPPRGPSVQDPATPQPAKNPGGAPRTDSELLDLVENVSAASRYGSERDQIVQDYAERPIRCVVAIDSVERTFGYTKDERFRNGRTVIGILRGTDCEAALMMPEDRNDEIDALTPGTTFQTVCRPVKWNNIYDRLEMQAE